MRNFLRTARGDFPLEETFSAFEELRRAGKILSWGVSNFDEADLEEARQVAGEEVVACDQVLYHLRQRAIEHQLPVVEDLLLVLRRRGADDRGREGGQRREDRLLRRRVGPVADLMDCAWQVG